MRRLSVCLSSALLILGVVGLTSRSALAQSDEGFDKSNEDVLEGKEHLDAEKSERMPGEKVKEPPKEDPTKYDPAEAQGKSYKFIGLRFRDIIVPKFFLNIFASGGATVNVFAFGPELTIRKDQSEYDFGISYADYSMDPFLFKSSDDPDFAWEEVRSSMKVLYFTVDYLHDFPLDDKGRFSLLVGGGIGLGIVFGNLYRLQVEPSGPGGINPDVPGSWRRCDEKPERYDTDKLGNDPTPYCDNKNDHYGKNPDRPEDYDEHSWFNGGKKPSIMPWITIPQVSFRYKPIKQVQTRFDAGLSLTGFFLGLSASYGL